MSAPSAIYGRKWSEKEYLIVLESYFAHRGQAQHADTPFVLELSEILGRTPHSILYRLQNFASLDPEETNPARKGKVNITPFGKRIFDAWCSKRTSLKETVEVLVRDERSQIEVDLFNPSPAKLPITFKHFELLDEIGKGGYGVVCSCIDTRSLTTHAIKVIDSSRVGDSECLHRFDREIRALKSVEHPHIIRILADNLDSEKNFPAFVMDLAECDLPAYISSAAKSRGTVQRPILECADALSIFRAVCDAVECLHSVNPAIVHRDINPSNILRLHVGRWVLADFSLAKFLPTIPVSTAFVTRSHVGLGTAHYTAPEQYDDLKNADQRADIFSLGWLIRDLFSSESPYPRRDPSGLPNPLEHVFHKAVEHDREKRWQTVTEMKAAFESAAEAAACFG